MNIKRVVVWFTVWSMFIRLQIKCDVKKICLYNVSINSDFQTVLLKKLYNFFLIRSISGPGVFSKMAKPSSLYKPILFLPIIDANPERRNRPTSSHNSVPSNEPIVTSNSDPLFFIQVLFFPNRTDFLQ